MIYRWSVAVFAALALLAGSCTSGSSVGGVSDSSSPSVSTGVSEPAGLVQTRWEGNDLVFGDDVHPVHLTSDGDRLWVLVQDEAVEPGAPPLETRMLLSVDVVTGKTVSETELSGAPTVLAFDDRAVWIGHWATGDVSRVDVDTREVVATIELELPFDMGNGPDRRLFVPSDMAFGHGSLWVSTARGAIARIDTATNRVVEMIALEGRILSGIAVGSKGVWVAENAGGVSHVDVASGMITSIPVEDLDHSASTIVVSGDDVYVVGDRLLRKQDGSFLVDAGSYTMAGQDAISRVEADTKTVADTTELDDRVVFLGSMNGFLGVLDETGEFHRVEAIPELFSQISETNWQSEMRVVQVRGGDTWMVDTPGSRILRLRETGPAQLSLPFEIDDTAEPRPIPPNLATSSDWVELDGGPLDPRWPGIVTWTGEEVVIWGGERRGGGNPLAGGAAYNPETNTWRTMADSPLGTVPEPAWVWTGEELVVWVHRTAAAWNPEDNTWREIDEWPLTSSSYRRAVWTGEEIVDADSGLAVDPDTGASRSIADPRGLKERASVLWADGYMVVVTSDGVYDHAAHTWAEMPDSGLTPLATAGTWTGSEVVAIDYEMNAAAYNPDPNSWTRLPEVPIRFFECFPRAHTIGTRPIAEHCAGIGIWDSERREWIPLAYPSVTDRYTPTLIPAGDQLYAWGSGFHRLKARSFDEPHRLAVGISYLDLTEDWTLAKARGGAAIAVELVSTAGISCSVTAIHADARGVISSYLDDEAVEIQFNPHVGGEPVEALQIGPGPLDELHHIVWAQGTTDVIDLACETREATEQIAVRIWSPWQ